MKIPLLVMANPRTTRKGPFVLLGAGDWSFETNHKDTNLNFYFGTSVSSFGTGEFKYKSEGDAVQLEVVSPGTESHITIYAVKCP